MKMSTVTEADWRGELQALVTSGAARSIRQHSGLSLAVVGRSVGAHPTAVARWENAERRPTTEAGARYLHLLQRLSKMQTRSPEGIRP